MFSGTFRWGEKKDKILLREVRQKEPYIERSGSKEAGQKWSEIAAVINTHADFAMMPRDQRSVRERFTKLLNDFNTKMNKEEKASGISPDDLSEVEQILEEIKEIITSNVSTACNSKDKSESERAKAAMVIRNKAMTSWGKEADEDGIEEADIKPKRKRSRRSGADPLEYLKIKKDAEMELKKEEMELRKEQLRMENMRYEAEQFLLQQRQMQQQMEAQAQSQALVMALLQKMNNNF